MRLVVDLQTLQTAVARRGIGRYVRSFLRALIRARPSWAFDAVFNTALPADAGEPLDGMRAVPFTPPLPMTPATRPINELYFGDWLASRGADALLEPSFFDEAAVVPQFVPPRPPLAGIAFDLVPVLFHEHYLASPPAHAIYRRRFRQFAQADLYLAISETTRRDVLQLMDVSTDRVVTIGGAADEWAPRVTPSDPAARARTLPALNVDGPFLLYVGGPDPRKNLHGTLEAFARLPEAIRRSCRLVIVCELTTRQESALRSQAHALGIETSLRLTSYVSDDTLRVLYEECRASIFPSFYEGLGLPVLEALACGAPVVASNRSPIPELTGDAAVLVDPDSPASICAGIEQVLATPRAAGEEARRRAAGAHTWDEVADRAASALERLAGGALVRPPSSRRPRVAWVAGSDPAQADHVAQLAAALLPALASAFDVEVVVAPGAVPPAGFAPGMRILSADAVWSRALERPFDLFVYHIGNAIEPFMAELLHWQAGLVVLHDWRVAVARPVLGASAAVAVLDAHAWHQVRERVPAPVYCVGPFGDLAESTAAARCCIAAIRATLAARGARDGAWIDAAALALSESRAADALTPRALEEWAQLRCEGRLRGW